MLTLGWLPPLLISFPLQFADCIAQRLKNKSVGLTNTVTLATTHLGTQVCAAVPCDVLQDPAHDAVVHLVALVVADSHQRQEQCVVASLVCFCEVLGGVGQPDAVAERAESVGLVHGGADNL